VHLGFARHGRELKVYPILRRSIRLALSDNKFAGKVFLPYLPGFFFNPAFKTHLLDAAEIVKFHVMRVLGSLVSRRREKGAREITAITAQLYTSGFDTTQCCTPLCRQMEMLSILLATPLARNIPLWYTHFGMNQFGKLICQIILVKVAVEAVQPTGRR
jgi:hypothetical protein